MDKASKVASFEEFVAAAVLPFESRVDEFRQPIPRQIILVLLSTIALAASALDRVKKAAFYGKELSESDLQEDLAKLRMLTHGTRHMVCPTDPTARVPYPIGYSEVDSSRKFHALLGMITETGEIASELAGAITDSRLLDIVNILEEIGDGHWYEGAFLDAANRDFLESLTIVHAKLQKRYGTQYNDAGALNRDTAAERAIMEGKLSSAPTPSGIVMESFSVSIVPKADVDAGLAYPAQPSAPTIESGGGGDFGGGGASGSFGSDSDGGTPD